jgi:hypothetical protein
VTVKLKLSANNWVTACTEWAKTCVICTLTCGCLNTHIGWCARVGKGTWTKSMWEGTSFTSTENIFAKRCNFAAH